MRRKLYYPIEFDRTKSYNENIAHAINKYWKLDVAHPANSNYVVSNTVGGVPRAASTTSYRHPDIVRIRKFGRNWTIIGK